MAITKKTRKLNSQTRRLLGIHTRKTSKDPSWYRSELCNYIGVKPPKQFCKKCRKLGHLVECCGEPTVVFPWTAHIPRKNASKARWNELFQAYPRLKYADIYPA